MGEKTMIRVLLVVLLALGAARPVWAQGLEYARAAVEAETRRDFEQAAALYTKAIDAGDLSKKDLRDALHYRGNANYFMGRFPAAAADYGRSLKADPSNIYVALWLYLTSERSEQGGKGELTRNAGALDLFYWPGPVVSLFLGQATAREVLLAAEDPFLDEGSQREQLCEAYFYLGEYLLLRGQRNEAAGMFRKALATGAKDFVEYDAAKVELERLGG